MHLLSSAIPLMAHMRLRSKNHAHWRIRAITQGETNADETIFHISLAHTRLVGMRLAAIAATKKSCAAAATNAMQMANPLRQVEAVGEGVGVLVCWGEAPSLPAQ